MKLKNTSCYNCGSNKSKLYDSENGFNLVRCNKCGLLYVNPRPSDDEITNSTMTGIHRGETDINVTNSFNENIIPRYLKILNDFYKADYLKNKSWLDIGCGNGEFLLALKEFTDNNIIVKGSEPNKLKIKSAKKHNLDVELLDLEKHEKQYDFISALNVFSHLPNPIKTLKSWKKLIKEDGELFIETGHSSHLPPKYHNKPYYLPDHLSFANKDLLVQMLEKIGFHIINVEIYRGIYYREINFTNITKEMVKFILRRPNSFHSFFPKYQHGDMFIRAKKSDIRKLKIIGEYEKKEKA